MAMDKEWFEVTIGGTTADGQSKDLNEEAANTLAASWAESTDDAVCVVYNRRTEIRRFQRSVTVTSTDVGTVPALSAGSGA